MFTSEEPEMSPPEIYRVGSERPGSDIYIYISEYTTPNQHIRFEWKMIRDGASEVQGLLLLILMDVVELVPSISFSPRTNIYGRMSDSALPKNHVL